MLKVRFSRKGEGENAGEGELSKASFRGYERSIYFLPCIGLNKWENASFCLTQRQGKKIDADIDEF